MTETVNSYQIGRDWVNLNTLSGIANTSTFHIQNNGLAQDIISMAVSALEPPADFKGVNVYQKEIKPVAANGVDVWARLYRIDTNPLNLRTASVNIQEDAPAIGAVKSFNQDFLLAVSKGVVPGHRLAYIHSYAPLIGTTEAFIWPLNGQYTFSDTPSQLYLTSSNAADTSFVFVRWIDANYDEQQGFYQLNGRTPVPIGIGLRVNQSFTAGTTKTLGNVYVSNALTHVAGVPTQATTVMMYEQKTQTRSMALYTVPRNHTAFGLSGYFSSPRNRDNDFFWNVRNPLGLLPPINTNVVSVYESTTEIDFKFTSIPEETDAWFTAKTETGTGRVSIRIPTVIVNNDYLSI